MAVHKTGRERVKLQQDEWRSGANVRRVIWYRGPSENEWRLYANLLEFLKEKGTDITCFERGKNKQAISSQINGMKTVLRKRGLNDEFYSRYYGRKDE